MIEKKKLKMAKYLDKAKRKIWLDKNKDEISKYNSNYMKGRRNWAKKNKICIRCFKNQASIGRYQCEVCLKHLRDFEKKRVRTDRGKVLKW